MKILTAHNIFLKSCLGVSNKEDVLNGANVFSKKFLLDFNAKKKSMGENVIEFVPSNGFRNKGIAVEIASNTGMQSAALMNY